MIDHLRDSFRQFARNGRWGTCGGCPHDEEGRAYPEFCASTDRYDHRLTVEDLAETYRRYERIESLKTSRCQAE